MTQIGEYDGHIGIYWRYTVDSILPQDEDSPEYNEMTF